jgi:hypothetical protein
MGMTAIILVASGSATAHAASPCDHARALYQTKYYADAEKAYKKLAGVAACATPKRMRAARAAAKPRVTTPEARIKQAQRLQDAGFDEDARRLTKSVAQNSNATIPENLRAVDQRTAGWRRALGWLGPPARFGLEALAMLLAVFVGALLAVTAIRALILRITPGARLDGFAGSSDEALGSVLSAGLGTMLTRMKDDGASETINWQSGTEPKFEVPTAVTKVLPQIGLVAGLTQMLDQLLYRRMYLVSGTVHPVREHRGAGLTLVVTTRRGSTVDRVTIWESDFMLLTKLASATESVRYERLIVPGAVWLGYCRKLGFHEGKAPLEASSWRSYALFAVCEFVPGADMRRRLLERALDRDSGNLGARLNLAAMLLRRPTYEVPPVVAPAPADGRRESWQERLEEAGRHLAIIETRTKVIDAIWYRGRYMQALRHIYLNEGAEARAKLRQLLDAIEMHGNNARLRGLLGALKQPADIAARVAELLETGSVTTAPEVDAMDWLSATAEYNLAGFWSHYAAVATNDIDRTARTAQAISSALVGVCRVM